MDLTLINTASAIQQSQTSNSVQTTVAGKVLDEARLEGAADVAMIKAASPGSQGGDPMTAAATGLGGQVDAFA